MMHWNLSKTKGRWPALKPADAMCKSANVETSVSYENIGSGLSDRHGEERRRRSESGCVFRRGIAAQHQ